MEVFLLYSLGPNYAAGLKSDMGLTEVFESFTEKNARILTTVFLFHRLSFPSIYCLFGICNQL